MQPVAATERAGRLAELGVDERVDDHGGPALGAVERELQVVDGLDARVADLFELLVGELRLERVNEADGGLARGVGDHVQLDGLPGHGESVTAAARPGCCADASAGGSPGKERSHFRHGRVTDTAQIPGYAQLGRRVDLQSPPGWGRARVYL